MVLGGGRIEGKVMAWAGNLSSGNSEFAIFEIGKTTARLSLINKNTRTYIDNKTCEKVIFYDLISLNDESVNGKISDLISDINYKRSYVENTRAIKLAR